MSKYFYIIVVFLASIACAPQVFADVIIAPGCYDNPATVNYNLTTSSQLNVYLAMGATPMANTTGSVGASSGTLNAFSWNTGAFAGTTDGDYQVLAVTAMSCAGLSYAACLAGNPGAYSEATFTIDSPCPVPPEQNATSTIEQVQQNTYYAFVIFMTTFFGMIWLLRKH